MAETLAFAAEGKVKADIELQSLSAINASSPLRRARAGQCHNEDGQTSCSWQNLTAPSPLRRYRLSRRFRCRAVNQRRRGGYQAAHPSLDKLSSWRGYRTVITCVAIYQQLGLPPMPYPLGRLRCITTECGKLSLSNNSASHSVGGWSLT